MLLIDADRQSSASYWAKKRSDRHPQLPAVQSVQQFGAGLMRTVRDMERRYDDLLVDAGNTRHEVRRARGVDGNRVKPLDAKAAAEMEQLYALAFAPRR